MRRASSARSRPATSHSCACGGTNRRCSCPSRRSRHERVLLTVAAFIERALYDPEYGYYARAAQRSGRAGDFFTSVDVGALFGTLLEVQLEEMASLLSAPRFDLVEAAAGNGRLSADILSAARAAHPDFYRTIRLHLVETSDAARGAQRDTLGDVAERLASSTPALPETFGGVLPANDPPDSMPVHQVVMREDGLREVYVAPGPERAAPPPRRGAASYFNLIQR